MEKWNINRAKLILQKDIEVSSLAGESGHYCDKCSYQMSETQCEVFDKLNELQEKLTSDVKGSLVYIAEYVCRSENATENDTFCYYDKYSMEFIHQCWIEVV
jgi:hypothetical protein